MICEVKDCDQPATMIVEPMIRLCDKHNRLPALYRPTYAGPARSKADC